MGTYEKLLSFNLKKVKYEENEVFVNRQPNFFNGRSIHVHKIIHDIKVLGEVRNIVHCEEKPRFRLFVLHGCINKCR